MTRSATSCLFATLLLLSMARADEDSSSNNNNNISGGGGHGDGKNPCLPGSDDGEMSKNDLAEDLTLQTLTGGAECSSGFADGFPCFNADLESFLTLRNMHPSGSFKYANDVWGYTSTKTGKRWAMMGMQDGTAFVDVTNPAEAETFAYMMNTDNRNSRWGDGKTYQHYFYKVTEESTQIQILDMNDLEDSKGGVIKPTVTYSNGFNSAHNIVINEESGFAASVGTSSCAGLSMMSLKENPLQPKYLGCYRTPDSRRGYTHDAQCVTYRGPDTGYSGREMCFTFDEDSVAILDATNVESASDVKHLATFEYDGDAYTHQGWLTEDHEYLLVNDELDKGRLRVVIIDVRDLTDPKLVKIFEADTEAIDHNIYVKGKYMYQAQYRFGLAVYDLSNVSKGDLELVAHFDTFKTDDSHNFNGAWSVYPYYDNGSVVVSSIGEGLFVVKPHLDDKETGTPTATPKTNSPTASPKTKSPTASPKTGFPTASPGESNPLSWDITMKEATDGGTDDGKPTIEILYESSKRTYTVDLYEDDCETKTDVLRIEHNEVDSPKKGFMNVDVTLIVEDQEELEDSPLWNDDGTTEGFSFCLSKSLLTPDGETVATQRKTKFRVAVDNQAGFSVDGIVVEQDEIKEEEIGMTYKGTVRGFVCDADTFEEKTEKEPLGPFDPLNVCVEIVASDEPDVVVRSISDMTIVQGDTGVSFVALKDGNKEDDKEDLVDTKCNDKGVCMVRTQLINAFFIKTTALSVGGQAVLGGGSGSGEARKLSLRGGRNERNQERKLQNGDGGFDLKVDLTKPCKEGEGKSAAKSILRNIGVIGGQN